MKQYFFIIICLSLLTAKCAQSEAGSAVFKAEAFSGEENSHQAGNAYTQLTLDSLQLENFIQKHEVNAKLANKMRTFYQQRQYQYAWFNEDGLAQQTQAFWNLHDQFVNLTNDSTIMDLEFHQRVATLMEDEIMPPEEELQKLEMQLTQHFFDYAKIAYAGKMDPEKLQWNIPRKKLDAVKLLDSLIEGNGASLEEWEPVNKQYSLLKKQLVLFHDLEKNNNWEVIKLGSNKIIRPGDSSPVIPVIRQRLKDLGDLPQKTDQVVYDNSLVTAVKRFQYRHGLKQDGVLGPATIKALNVTPEEKMEQLLVNMERMRWMPEHKAGKRIIANIPEFRLYVYEEDQKVMQMDIVVGKEAHKTVVFSDELKHVVFSPYWNIPASITRNEILPAMNRDPNYLSKKNMEITGKSNGQPVIRQKPGPDNALGKVKFLFPNRYAIYFHDTPAKSLFDRNRRAFSHGCIRLKEPFKMAQYLLKDKPEWTDERIRQAMNRGSELWVNLDEAVPVFICYFTAFVDDEGLVHFRDDIYGHDQKMSKQLFAHGKH